MRVEGVQDGGGVMSNYAKILREYADVFDINTTERRNLLAAADEIERLHKLHAAPTSPAEFKEWWDKEGSYAPRPTDDMYEHCRRMCKIAWARGANKALEQSSVQTAVERGLLALDKPTDPEAEREALRAILHGIAELARVMEVKL